MTTFKAFLSKELEDLKTLRDELRVKAHLARADLNDELDKLDARWPEVEQAAKTFEAATLEVGAQIEKAARDALGELRRAYDQLTKHPETPAAQASDAKPDAPHPPPRQL